MAGLQFSKPRPSPPLVTSRRDQPSRRCDGDLACLPRSRPEIPTYTAGVGRLRSRTRDRTWWNERRRHGVKPKKWSNNDKSENSECGGRACTDAAAGNTHRHPCRAPPPPPPPPPPPAP